METRRLGRLGHQSSVLLYGGAALAQVDQDTADRSIEEALAAGITHLDVAASYGEAEVRLGATLPGFRDRVFVATKTGDREAGPARRSIERSLERLRTDHVDLLQLHAVGDLDELDRVTGPGGALEAAVAAQEEGLVGAVGITGHGPAPPRPTWRRCAGSRSRRCSPRSTPCCGARPASARRGPPWSRRSGGRTRGS